MTTRRRWAGRLLLFGGSLVAGTAAWAALRSPDGSAGALIAMAASETALPALILFVLTVPSGIRESFPGRRRRIEQRKASRRSGARRPAIPARLKRMLRAAYRGRCVACRARAAIQYEHTRPYSLGGRTWFWNMTLLCSLCNEIKSSYWVERDGWVADGHGRVNRRAAARILRRERLARHNPLVYWRAAWAWF